MRATGCALPIFIVKTTQKYHHLTFVVAELITRMRHVDKIAQFKGVPPNQMYGVFDSLNTLAACPWKINQRV